jgi:ABC-2 type transport system permease protein
VAVSLLPLVLFLYLIGRTGLPDKFVTVFATLRKELLLLLRDPGGLLLLLIMPAALIIVMAVVQDAPYRDYQEMKFEILVANEDKGSAGEKIVQGLRKNQSFQVIDTLKDAPVSNANLRDLLKGGDYQMGIIIPEATTATLVHTSNLMAREMARSLGMEVNLPTMDNPGQPAIQLLFDPVVKPSFRSALNFALNQYLTQVKTEILLQRIGKMNGKDGEVSVNLEALDVLPVQEQSLEKEVEISPSMNSVQHNVPAWAIFGMFLIVVPISGNMIRERDEGSALRIRLIPSATRKVGLGKIVFYVLVCMLQFFVMLLVGLYLLPVFGLPRLSLGAHPWTLFPISIAIAFAAVSYGYFIGSVFKTANQAMPFGAISVVLFSAMGGVWVPVEILPESMRLVALASPLHWSLDAVNEVILRGKGIAGVLKPIMILLASGALLSVLPVFWGKK